MSADAVLSRELKGLHSELSAPRAKRSAAAHHRGAAEGKATRTHRPSEDSAEQQQLQAELREFADAIKELIEDAEKNVSAHPAASVLGALVTGILIGRLLGRH